MDERWTLRVLGWTMTGIMLLLFALDAAALPH